MELGKSVGYQFVQRKFKKVYEATLQSTDWPHVRLHVLAAAHLGSEYQRTALQRAKDLFAPASLQIVTIEAFLMCNDGKYLHAAELMGDFLGLYPDCLSNASNETSIEFMDVYIFNILANLGRYDQARSFVAAQNWIEVERTQQLIRDIDRAEEHGEYESEYIKIEEPITESDSSRVVNVDPSEGNSQSSDDQLTKSESTNERDSEKKTKPMNALDKLRRILSLSKMPGVICVLGILISIAVRRLLARSSKTSILQLLRKLAIL